MSGPEEKANLGQVLTVLREWDRGDRGIRSRILKTFVAENRGKAACELERSLAQVSSLFLARLTTWMKLTYMTGTVLGLQLKAIGIFLSAQSQDRYLIEFLEDEGVLILLDIVRHHQTKDVDKAEALHLLLAISKGGCKYKEIICETQGVKVSAECLTMSNADAIFENACALLESLYHGNPKYQEQVYRGLISIVDHIHPRAQQLVLHTLHTVQHSLNTAPECIVVPLLNVLKTPHPEVQDEAFKLIMDLKQCDVRAVLFTGLVALLRPNKEAFWQKEAADDCEMIVGAVSAFVQQAAAAKAIRLLTEEDQVVSKELFSLGVIQNLLSAMGNRDHIDAQIQASLALERFVHSFPNIEEQVQRVMGHELFAALMRQPDTLYRTMNESQAEVLRFNKISSLQSSE